MRHPNSSAQVFGMLLCTAALVACGTVPPPTENTRRIAESERNTASEQQLIDSEIEDIAATLEKYEWTPFTLSLVGEAPIPKELALPDMQSATDVAYCELLLERDAYQTRIGSDFSKRALEAKNGFRSILRELVIEPGHAEQLVTGAAGLFESAVDYARSSSNPQAALYFNFGNHKQRCLKALSAIQDQ